MSSAPESSPEKPEKKGSFVRHAGIVSFYTSLSRVAGLVRDTAFAHFFGATHATDAFLTAFTIPNTFRMLVAEGALTVAFLPVFKKVEKEEGAEASKRLMSQALAVFPTLALLVSALGILAAEPIVLLFAKGFDKVPGKLEHTVWLTRWMFGYLAMISFVALSMGALNARQRFASSAASPLVFNLVHIVWIVAMSRLFADPMLGVAFGVLLGGLAQIVVQVVALRRAQLWTRPSFGLDPAVRRILMLMGPAVGSFAVYQLNVMVLRLFTSFLGEGAVTYLYNADRFFQLPLGVFSIAIATASLPALADAESDGRARLAATFRQSLQLTNFITIPATVGLAVLALPICATVLQHGRFTHEMAANTALALVALSVGLVAVSGIRIAAQVFFAMQDTRTPMVCGAVGLVSNVAYAPWLAMQYDFVGLAMSISLSAWTQLAVELLLLRMRAGKLGLRQIGGSGLRGLAAAAVMGVATYWVARLGAWEEGFGVVNTAILILACVVGAGIYGLLQWLLGSPELSQVVAKLGRRLARRAPERA